MAMIIAEAGTNHAATDVVERVFRAYYLVDTALEAGADAIKFQLFVSDEDLFCPLPGDERRWRRWEHATFISLLALFKLRNYCDEKNIELILSAFQPRGVEWINELGLRHKVASRARNTYPGKMDIVSSMDVPVSSGLSLYCIPEYPCPLEKARWNDEWHGLSDHSGTPWPAIDALARGAEIVEVHFRIDDEPSPDLSSSLTLDQLKLVCEARDAFAQMRQD